MRPPSACHCRRVCRLAPLVAADRSTFTPQLHEGHPITTDDLERDAVFAQRVRLFGWVREKHLDVPEGEAAQGFLGFAEQGGFVSSATEADPRTAQDQPLQGAAG